MEIWSRRSFLRNAALAGGSLVLPGGVLLSCKKTPPTPSKVLSWEEKTDRPHYFVFYYMIGGWDLMLTTDPMEKGIAGALVPYEKEEIIEVGAHRFGPAMAPVQDFMDKMAIIKGIYVRALNHPQARFRLVTGKFKPPFTTPAASIQTLLADEYKDRYAIPNLSGDSMRPQVFRGPEDLKLEPLRVRSIQQLKALASVEGSTAAYQDEIKAAIRQRDEWMQGKYPNHPLVAEFGDFAQLAHAANQGHYPDLVEAAEADMNTVTSATGRNADQARLAVETIRQDLAPCVTVGTGEFDSHTANQYRNHARNVIRGMKTVGQIAKGLQESVLSDGSNLLDHTTIVVSSEFSRDPAKNELGGKHHWSTNSMILIGKGVKTNPERGVPTVWGRTDENLAALPINPKNGSSEEGAVDLEITYPLATILAMKGIDPVPHLGVEAIPDLLG